MITSVVRAQRLKIQNEFGNYKDMSKAAAIAKQIVTIKTEIDKLAKAKSSLESQLRKMSDLDDRLWGKHDNLKDKFFDAWRKENDNFGQEIETDAEADKVIKKFAKL